MARPALARTTPDPLEAQTLANAYHAIEANHEIIPVLNKVDLPAAEPERVKKEIEDVIGLDASQAIPAPAKTGIGRCAGSACTPPKCMRRASSIKTRSRSSPQRA